MKVKSFYSLAVLLALTSEAIAGRPSPVVRKPKYSSQSSGSGPKATKVVSGERQVNSRKISCKSKDRGDMISVGFIQDFLTNGEQPVIISNDQTKDIRIKYPEFANVCIQLDYDTKLVDNNVVVRIKNTMVYSDDDLKTTEKSESVSRQVADPRSELTAEEKYFRCLANRGYITDQRDHNGNYMIDPVKMESEVSYYEDTISAQDMGFDPNKTSKLYFTYPKADQVDAKYLPYGDDDAFANDDSKKWACAGIRSLTDVKNDFPMIINKSKADTIVEQAEIACNQNQPFELLRSIIDIENNSSEYGNLPQAMGEWRKVYHQLLFSQQDVLMAKRDKIFEELEEIQEEISNAESDRRKKDLLESYTNKVQELYDEVIDKGAGYVQALQDLYYKAPKDSAERDRISELINEFNTEIVASYDGEFSPGVGVFDELEETYLMSKTKSGALTRYAQQLASIDSRSKHFSRVCADCDGKIEISEATKRVQRDEKGAKTMVSEWKKDRSGIQKMKKGDNSYLQMKQQRLAKSYSQIGQGYQDFLKQEYDLQQQYCGGFFPNQLSCQYYQQDSPYRQQDYLRQRESQLQNYQGQMQNYHKVSSYMEAIVRQRQQEQYGRQTASDYNYQYGRMDTGSLGNTQFNFMDSMNQMNQRYNYGQQHSMGANTYQQQLQVNPAAYSPVRQ